MIFIYNLPFLLSVLLGEWIRMLDLRLSSQVLYHCASIVDLHLEKKFLAIFTIGAVGQVDSNP